MKNNVYIYIFVMAGVTYLVRLLPLTILRREIKNRFIRSFLYYMPYVTLSVMTFPAILGATGSVISSGIGLAAALVIAWVDGNLFKVSLGACAAALVSQLVVNYAYDIIGRMLLYP